MRLWTVPPWLRGQFQRMKTLLGSVARRQMLPLVLVMSLLSTIFAPFAQAGFGLAAPAYAEGRSGSGTPNLFNPRADTTSVGHPDLQIGPIAGNPLTPGQFNRSGPPSMQPGLLSLHPGQPAHFLGSDGRFEVNVPAGAITNADLTPAATGQLNLKITQIAPASGSNAGGSGHISFGTYLLQVVDGAGKLVPHGLRQPMTLTFHYGPGSATDVAHAFVVFNSALPAGVSLASAPATLPAGVSTSVFQLGSARTQPATLNSTQQTLSVSTTLSTAATSASFTDLRISC